MFYWQLVFLLCFSVWKRAEVSAEVVSSLMHNGVDYNNAHAGPGAGKTYSNHRNLPRSMWYRPMEENESEVTQGTLPDKSVNALPPKVDTGNKMAALRTTRIKRSPTGFTARGFHEEVFDRDFGHFSPVKRSHKRRPEADAAGFYGDTFSNGFGEFETMKKSGGLASPAYIVYGDGTIKRPNPYNNWISAIKRKQEMTKSGFHGDVFNGGFGEFHPMRK